MPVEQTDLTVRQLAGILNVHVQTVYSKASAERPLPAGCIPGYRVGRAWRFDLDEVKRARASVNDPWVRQTGKAA